MPPEQPVRHEKNKEGVRVMTDRDLLELIATHIIGLFLLRMSRTKDLKLSLMH
jgi:hypothetical protein